ncbi:MAG: hypothetical protein LBS25_01990 [Candidatus Symbiothrix sp.]|jgi:hypothetical protein|nr:hypothetical protein [Candidatus Symbiothrix sp.]
MQKVCFKIMMAAVILLSSVQSNAQVRIGAAEDPHPGAILDLSKGNTDLGLLLPNVALTDVEVFQLSLTGSDQAKGMLVYNTSTTTKGANGITGEFIWDGLKWRSITSVSRMTLTTTDNWGMSDKPVPAEGNQSIEATISDENCSMSGEYQFIVLSGPASVTPATSITPEFNIQFNVNPYGNPVSAVVQVISPCYQTATFVFHQQGATCSASYNVKSVQTYNDPSTICSGGAVYAYVAEVTNDANYNLTEDEMSALAYYWMLGHTLVATGRGVSLTQAGIYTVYAGMQGCGTIATVTPTSSPSTAPGNYTLLMENNGIICGTRPVKLQVLGVEDSNSVKWFKNGLLQPTYNGQKTIELDNESDVGNWSACVTDAGGCWSKPTQSVSVSYSNSTSPITPPTVLANGLPIEDITEVCANSTVRLEIQNPEQYGETRHFYWYLNDKLWGESSGEAIYIVPTDLTSCVLSVRMTTTMDACPVTVASGELTVNYSAEPQQPMVAWKGDVVSTANICRDTPAMLSCTQTGTKYQWFKDGLSTPYYEAALPQFMASQPGTYTVRYENASGCWSRISDPIQVVQSSSPFLQWQIKPASIEYFGTETTYSISAAPAPDQYTWTLLKNGDIYDPADVNNPSKKAFRILPYGDGSSAMVSFPAKSSIPSGDLTNDLLTDLSLEVRGSNSCGEGFVSGPFYLMSGCQAIGSVELQGSSNKLQLGQSIQYNATISSGTAPYYYQGWVYVENAQSSIIPGWTGANGHYNANGLEFWVFDSDRVELPNGVGVGYYKKMLFLPWGTTNQITIQTFAVGKHYILCEAANDMDGLGDLSSSTQRFETFDVNTGTYINTSPSGSTCTGWDNPKKSALKLLEVTANTSSASPTLPDALNYTVFMGGKTCFDVHKTGDTESQAWGNNRLPLNVRPDDFSTSTMVGGYYVVNYSFKGGYKSITTANSSGSVMTTDKTAWNNIPTTINYLVSDPNGIVADVTGNGTETAVLRFKPNVVSLGTGKTRNSALKVTLYAIYQYNSSSYKDSVIISIQDAACGCPAKITTNTWRIDMCHAAGANYTQDPYGESDAVFGAYYKWGNGTPAATYAERELNHVRSISGTTWNMETNNPCPEGWVVASWTELAAIATPDLNLHTSLSNDRQTRGYIPIRGGGYRGIGSADSYVGSIHESNNCHTWSANAVDNGEARNKYFYRSGGSAGGSYTKNYGEHVRCVQEGGTYTVY